MRNAKYAIFATVEGEEKLIEGGSVRFSRANWRARQLAKYYPGVFFRREGEKEKHTPRLGATAPEVKHNG